MASRLTLLEEEKKLIDLLRIFVKNPSTIPFILLLYPLCLLKNLGLISLINSIPRVISSRVIKVS